MVGIAMANPNGKNSGCSCAYSPICWDENGICVDNTILLADDMSEGLLYAEFDMDAIRDYRRREMMGNTFRKVDAYDELMNRSISEPFKRSGQD
jgi:predicted amidohydrolase